MEWLTVGERTPALDPVPWRDLALVAALVVIPGLSTLRAPFGGSDEAILLVYPERISNGATPNVDFFTVYGPGGYRLLQAIYAFTGGPSVVAERAVAVGYHLSIAVGLMYLTRRLGPYPSLAAGLTAAAVLLGFAPLAYAWLGGVALLTLALGLLASRSTSTAGLFLAGVLAGLVPYWRPEMGMLLIGSVPLVVSSRRWRPYVVGLVVGSLPLGLHLLTAGPAVVNNIVTSRLLVNAQTSLSLVDAHVWLILALCVATVAFLVLAAMKDQSNRDLFLALAITGALMLPQALQRTDIWHTVFVGCFILPAGLALAVSRIRASAARWAVLVATAGLTVAAVAVSTAMITVQTQVTANGSREVSSDPVVASRLDRIIDLVHQVAPSGSRVFVGPQDLSRPGFGYNELYYLLPEYPSDFYFLEIPPGIAERAGSPLLRDVLSADVLILNPINPVVLDMDLPHVGRGDEGVNRAVAESFCMIAEIDGTRVYVKGGC